MKPVTIMLAIFACSIISCEKPKTEDDKNVPNLYVYIIKINNGISLKNDTTYFSNFDDFSNAQYNFYPNTNYIIKLEAWDIAGTSNVSAYLNPNWEIINTYSQYGDASVSTDNRFKHVESKNKDKSKLFLELRVQFKTTKTTPNNVVDNDEIFFTATDLSTATVGGNVQKIEFPYLNAYDLGSYGMQW